MDQRLVAWVRAVLAGQERRLRWLGSLRCISKSVSNVFPLLTNTLLKC